MRSAAYTVALLLGLAPQIQAVQGRDSSPYEATRETKDDGKSAGDAPFTNNAKKIVLTPNVHWSYDTKPVANVRPVEAHKGTELYYGHSDPSKSGHFAFLTYYLKHPSVNIDHTDHITVQYHPQDGLVAKFQTKEAFDHARETWTADDGLLLIAYVPGCGHYDKGERCYFGVTSLEFKSQHLTVIAKGSPKHPEDITAGGETNWGYWEAGKGSAPPASAKTPSGQPPVLKSRAPPSAGEARNGDGGARAFLDKRMSSPDRRRSGPHGCVAPPPDPENKLPTACAGKHFDLKLDKNLGYEKLSAESEKYLEDLMSGTWSGLDSKDGVLIPPTGPRKRGKSLMRRDVYEVIKGFLDWFHYILDPNGNKELWPQVNFTSEFDVDIPDPLSKDSLTNRVLGSTPVVNTVWGQALLLKTFDVTNSAPGSAPETMDVLCVGCGLTGRVKIAGIASWDNNEGITTARLEVDATLIFTVKLGIRGHAALVKDFATDLFRIGLPGLSWSVIEIGPVLSLGANFHVEAEASGSMLAGAEISMQDVHIVVDLVDSTQNEYEGVRPIFEPIFQAEGDLRVDARMGLPFGISCGVKIWSWQKTWGLIDEPSITATATAAGKVVVDNGGITGGYANDCAGIVTAISWRNRLTTGPGGVQTDRPWLDSQDRDLFHKCIGKLKKPNPPSRRANTIDAGNERGGFGRRNLQRKRSEPQRITKDYKMSMEPAAEPYDKSHNTKLAPLVQYEGTVKVYSCADGNVYAAPDSDTSKANRLCRASWEMTAKSTVVYDGVHRALHFYKDTMSALGVSRLRVSSANHVPKGSGVVALLPVENDKGPNLYVAVDAADEVYVPAVCHFADRSPSKVFLVRDAVAGAKVLQGKDVVNSITGGEVTECHPLGIKV